MLTSVLLVKGMLDIDVCAHNRIHNLSGHFLWPTRRRGRLAGASHRYTLCAEGGILS